MVNDLWCYYCTCLWSPGARPIQDSEPINVVCILTATPTSCSSISLPFLRPPYSLRHSNIEIQFSSVQSLSHVWLFATPWTAACQASLSITNSQTTQTHVHRVNDAIQPSHPLSSPSPPALNLSQHQGLFQWVSSSHQMAKVLEVQLQHQSFQWTRRTDLL